MNVLYLSETEGLQSISLEYVLAKFVKKGVNPIDLKDMVRSIDAQGFFIGNDIFGSYVVIRLDLPNFTISIQRKKRVALKGTENYSSV